MTSGTIIIRLAYDNDQRNTGQPQATMLLLILLLLLANSLVYSTTSYFLLVFLHHQAASSIKATSLIRFQVLVGSQINVIFDNFLCISPSTCEFIR